MNSDVYDTGPKQRVPAWTDRILYVEKQGFTCIAYDADFSLRTSDHRPVFATFSVDINVDQYISHSNNSSTDQKVYNSNRSSHPEFSSESQVCSIM